MDARGTHEMPQTEVLYYREANHVLIFHLLTEPQI